MSKKRYIATVTFYVHEDSPEEAFTEATHIASELKDQLDNSATLDFLHLQEYGTMDCKEIDIKEIKSNLNQ